MEINLIKETVSGIIGKSGEKLVDILYAKKNVNEFLIAKKLGLTINQTRNLLYKLSDKGLVHFIRKKDSKKGGWYTYFWTLDEKRALEVLKEQKSVKSLELETESQKRKNERFYYCPASGLEYNEEQALEHNFICPETGEVLQLKDNKEEVENLETEITRLRAIVEKVNLELQEIEKKDRKSKDKKMRSEKKKKETERKEKKEKLKKERKSSEKKEKKNKNKTRKQKKEKVLRKKKNSKKKRKKKK